MEAGAYRCPDCGGAFDGASALVDHSLSTHVEAETRAGGMRKPKHPGLLRALGVVGVMVGAAFSALLLLVAVGVFDKAAAPESPGSVVHGMAVDLHRSGQVDDYRAVEPEGGWDTEYEFNDGYGFIRIRNEGTPSEELEVLAHDEQLRRTLEREAEARGFVFFED